jgi:tetratricopeptide (TPR) repeat protein
MLQRKTLTIRRDDHLGDSLGAAIFESSNDRHILAQAIRDYLGRRITLVRAEVGSRDALITVDAHSFPVEAQRLNDEAELLWRSGARRSATTMRQQACDLDPLNADIIARLGADLLELKRPAEAIAALIHARELAIDTAELLRNMGRACMMLNRKGSAIAYFRQALALEPKDFISLRAMARLGYTRNASGSPETGRKRIRQV